jgi:lanosterol synthase
VGSWGICFTYATMFALESLSLVGETYETSESARRACDFLVSKQRADGGWGESYKVCPLPQVHSKRGSFWGARHARPAYGSNTRTLKSSKRPGRRWRSCTQSTQIRSRSQKLWHWSCPVSYRFVVLALHCVSPLTAFQDGSWAQEAIEGIFNRTCAISYPNFKFSFTIWMLGKAHKYLEERGALPS